MKPVALLRVFDIAYEDSTLRVHEAHAIRGCENVPPGDHSLYLAAPGIPTAQRWIPVTERCPNYSEDAKVLCFTRDHDYGGEQFHTLKASDFYEYDPDGDGEPGTDLARNVTHWMPLPWPPADEAISTPAVDGVLAVPTGSAIAGQIEAMTTLIDQWHDGPKNPDMWMAAAAGALSGARATLADAFGVAGNDYHTNCHEPLMKDDPT